MSENERKILQMVADGKINVDEAQRLLSLVGSQANGEENQGTASQKTRTVPRYLHVIVEPRPGVTGDSCGHHPHKKVNIRVPINLIRAGIRFATLIPTETADHMDRAFKEKGFAFDIKKVKEEDLQNLISSLENSEINVDNEREAIRIYAE